MTDSKSDSLKVVDSEIKNEELVKKSPSFSLSNEEILKFKNIHLQKQLANKELQSMRLQEEIVARQVSDRVGQNVTNWEFSLEEGIVTNSRKKT